MFIANVDWPGFNIRLLAKSRHRLTSRMLPYGHEREVAMGDS